MLLSLGFLSSSIGRKVIVSAASVMLIVFLLAHLSGNLLIYAGADAMNGYAVFLQSVPWLLWPIRILTLIAFVIHMVMGIVLAIENRRARPVGYKKQTFKKASLASRAMGTSGLVLLTYVIYHLLHFTFGVVHSEYYHLTDSLGRHNVYQMVVYSFQDFWISAAYVLSIVSVSLHISHGIPSLFQTIGLKSKKSEATIQQLGIGIATFVFVGYTSIPIAIYLGFVT